MPRSKRRADNGFGTKEPLMKKLVRRRSSAAIAVAVVAAVVAASGTAIAMPGGGTSPPGAEGGTHGVFKMHGTANGNTATMIKFGPFTVTMTCTTTGSGSTATTSLTVQAKSSEANSWINGTYVTAPGTYSDLGDADLQAMTGPGELSDVVWD